MRGPSTCKHSKNILRLSETRNQCGFRWATPATSPKSQWQASSHCTTANHTYIEFLMLEPCRVCSISFPVSGFLGPSLASCSRCVGPRLSARKSRVDICLRQFAVRTNRVAQGEFRGSTVRFSQEVRLKWSSLVRYLGRKRIWRIDFSLMRNYGNRGVTVKCNRLTHSQAVTPFDCIRPIKQRRIQASSNMICSKPAGLQ